MEEVHDNIDFYLQMLENEERTFKEREMAANNLHKKIDDIKIDDIRFERILSVIDKEYNNIEEDWSYREQMFHHLLSIGSEKIRDTIALGEKEQVKKYLSDLIIISEYLVQKKIDLRIKETVYGILRQSERNETIKIILKQYDENYDESMRYELKIMELTLIALLKKENFKSYFYNVTTIYQNLCEKAPNEIRTESIRRIIEYFR